MRLLPLALIWIGLMTLSSDSRADGPASAEITDGSDLSELDGLVFEARQTVLLPASQEQGFVGTVRFSNGEVESYTYNLEDGTFHYIPMRQETTHSTVCELFVDLRKTSSPYLLMPGYALVSLGRPRIHRSGPGYLVQFNSDVSGPIRSAACYLAAGKTELSLLELQEILGNGFSIGF